MKKSIGGYLGLELRKGGHFHDSALKLNTARNCLEYILKIRKYSKVFIPFYNCDVVLEPLNKCNVLYEFYQINEKLEPIKDFFLKDNEAFLYTNYFGLKQDCVEKLATKYKSRLIVDNAQAFYAKPLPDIDTFYSARKFFGVSDGAYLYINKLLETPLKQDHSFNRMNHLLKRIDLSAEEGFTIYQMNDNLLNNNPILRMSNITAAILSSVEYELIKKIRRENFIYIHNKLSNSNLIQFEFDKTEVPMVYPYLIEGGNKLKKKLIEKKIYVATYWPNVLIQSKKDSYEYYLANNLVNIPIDQRYNDQDMRYIINIISKHVKKIL